MSDFLVVVPVLDWQIAAPLFDSIVREGSAAGFGPDEILLVDNAREANPAPPFRTYRDPDGHNLGVPGGWNIGAREVVDRGLDYVVLMSAVMEFGPLLHCTLVSQMRTFWGAPLIEAEGHSWHMIAIHREVFETVGFFDENFYPGYHEGIDFHNRMTRGGIASHWPRVWVNALSRGVAAHIEMVTVRNAPLARYYSSKWGGEKGAETFDLPWGDKPLDYWPEVDIPEIAKRYELGTYGTGWW